MAGFLQALSDGARAGACSLLGTEPYIADMIDRLGFPDPLGARSVVPDFWRNSLCSTPAPPPPGPPFTGGQCQASYNVVVTWVGQSRTFQGTCVDSSGSSNGSIVGPITFLGIERTDVGSSFFLTARFRDRNGQQATIATSGFSDQCGGGTITNITVSRIDGLPDNCGDPPPVPEPLEPDDVTINQNITYQNNDGLDVTIPVIFVYARANIDARANITIPFTANINGELNVTGNLNLDGTVNINIGTAGGAGSPKDPRKSPCDDIAIPTETPPEDPTDSEQPDQPDREREETIIGVLVTVTSLANERASTIVQVDNPDIYVPSLGHVNFLCRVGETSGGWTTDIQVKNRRHLIQCPWSLGAVAVRGTPQPGVTWELTPIYGYAGIPVEYVQ